MANKQYSLASIYSAMPSLIAIKINMEMHSSYGHHIDHIRYLDQVQGYDAYA